MIGFYFITLENVGAATIIDPKSKGRFICFKDNKIAASYGKYISNQKYKYGKWPCIDLSRRIMSSAHSSVKCEHVDDCENKLSMSYKTWEDLDKMTASTGIQYFLCNDFTYEGDSSFKIQGMEIDGEIDRVIYTNHLEYNIKNM
tara:strand:- start:10803 stop:11234 length:432 start_codon:yes stop_codon:yes gene_type:complete